MYLVRHFSLINYSLVTVYVLEFFEVPLRLSEMSVRDLTNVCGSNIYFDNIIDLNCLIFNFVVIVRQKNTIL